MKTIRRARRRHALNRIRAQMIALGRDPGDLKRARNYRRFLKGLRRVTSAARECGLGMATLATAMQEFGKAWTIAQHAMEKADELRRRRLFPVPIEIDAFAAEFQRRK